MTDLQNRKAGSGVVDPDDFNAVIDAVNGVVSARVVTGTRDSAESALKNLLTALAAAGVITDSTTAS